jgi:elongation factor Tu
MKDLKKKEFIRNKLHCNIGTIGHVDHGKTTLTSAITKVCSGIGDTKFFAYEDIDSNVQERSRKITINAAHIEYETEKRHYSHIDCPGHQDYIKNMIVGAFQMEGVILVISAIDGPQVQTREHIILAKEIKIPYLIVFLNKMDLLKDSEMIEMLELEIREILENYGFDESCPFIKGSAKLALEEKEESSYGILSIKELLFNIDNYIKDPERPLNEPFLMSVENSIAVKGRGTVVTGKILKGKVKINDELEFVGKYIYKTVCLGLEIYKKSLTEAEVGDNVGILLKGIDKKKVSKSYVLAAPNSVKVFSRFKAKVYILKTEEGGRKKPFKSGYSPQFYLRTASITGSILNVDDENALILPGDVVEIIVNLVEPIVLEQGLHFVMREGKLTIGRGTISSLMN